MKSMEQKDVSPALIGRKFAKESLDKTVEFFLRGDSGFPQREPKLTDAAGLPWEVPMEVSLDFHAGAWDTATPAERDEVARQVWGHRERLEALLVDRARFRNNSPWQKQDTFRELAFYVALVLVPSFSHLGRYPHAVRMARLLFRFSRSRPFRQVYGAGARGEPIMGRHLYMTVVLWALACHYPTHPDQDY
jgi:hypothetical protein